MEERGNKLQTCVETLQNAIKHAEFEINVQHNHADLKLMLDHEAAATENKKATKLLLNFGEKAVEKREHKEIEKLKEEQAMLYAKAKLARLEHAYRVARLRFIAVNYELGAKLRFIGEAMLES